MTHSNEPPELMTTLAKLIAATMVLLALGIYLFPWFVPFFWDMPEGTTAPYYGLLVAYEATRSLRVFEDQRKQIK